MNYWLHITAVPDGEAPLWVRECWVGLKIPLAQTTKSAQLHVSCGVLTGPKNPFTILIYFLFQRKHREMGYLVETLTAVKILEAQHPLAAKWWKENTPYMIRPNNQFFFSKEVGFIND